jgi:hypothetical protein
MNVWPGGIINKFGGLVYEKLKQKEETAWETLPRSGSVQQVII